MRNEERTNNLCNISAVILVPYVAVAGTVSLSFEPHRYG